MNGGRVQPDAGRAVAAAMLVRVMIAWAVASPCVCARGEPPAPGPAPVVERVTAWRRAGVASWALSNGVDFHARQMSKPGAGKVTLMAFVPGVELREGAGERGSAVLAAAALRPAEGEAGGVSVRAVLRPEGLLLTATCAGAELEAAVGLVVRTLSDPVFDERLFESARGEAVAQAAEADGRQEHRAVEAVLALIGPADDARLRRPTVEELKGLAFGRATGALARGFASLPVDVAVAGDVDAAAVEGALRRLGALPVRARDRLEGLRVKGRLAPPEGKGDATLELPHARGALTVLLPAPASTSIGEARVASVASRVAERRIAEGLRESGLTVGRTSAAAVSGRTHPGLGSVICTFYIGGEPARLRSAAGVARSRVAALVEEGPGRSEAGRAAEEAARDVEPLIASAEYWAQSVAMAWYLGVPVDELGEAPAEMRGMTAQRLRRHMEEWWKPAGIVTVTVVPGEGAGGGAEPEQKGPAGP